MNIIDKMKTDILPTQIGTVNINGIGTRYWIEPGYPVMEAIFGQGPKNRDQVIDWCVNTFDRTQWDISAGHVNRYLFKQQSDRTAFILKWCSHDTNVS
jgi:hypothetical protein